MAKARVTEKAVTTKTAGKTALKKTATKAAAKRAVTGKNSKKDAGVKAGRKYLCEECGLSVTVDTACGCAEATHFICCDKPMKAKK
jgi:hypothetical protein